MIILLSAKIFLKLLFLVFFIGIICTIISTITTTISAIITTTTTTTVVIVVVLVYAAVEPGVWYECICSEMQQTWHAVTAADIRLFH